MQQQKQKPQCAWRLVQGPDRFASPGRCRNRVQLLHCARVVSTCSSLAAMWTMLPL